ncbi:hypothetical protein [Candidatus Poriferisodalis sp.]|uniref:hypothetical protein n=1 Tax=Candidatus Poriferisodalis sp. TaxID=3101277 RepID=UPI003D0FA121
MSVIWLLPAIAFGVLAIVSALLIRRLCAELRATERALNGVIEATASVRDDVERARTAIDQLDVPSLRQVTVERALGMSVRWVARRILPL